MDPQTESPAAPSADLTKELLEIPSFPPVAARLLHLTSGEDADIEKVIELVRAEPSISARILLMANSALYGFASRVDSLPQAVVLLGLARIKALAVTAAAAAYTKTAHKVEELRRCWRHTLACAQLTAELARACQLDPDRAYTAGLMHDIGRLGLVVAFPDKYVRTLRDAAEKSLDVLDYERQRFGMDHAELGCLLLGHWNFPPEFLPIAGRHHDRPGGAEVDLLTLVHLGCQLADTLGFEVVRPLRPMTLEQVRESLPQAARDRFRHSAQELAELVGNGIRSLDPPDPEAGEPEPEPEPEEAPLAISTPPPEAAPRLSRMERLAVAATAALVLATAWVILNRLG